MARSSTWIATLFGNARRFPIAKKPAGYRPQLERLEDRLAPAVRVWDGGGADTLASNPLNWSEDILPTSNDTLVLDASEGPSVILANFDAAFLHSIKDLRMVEPSGGAAVVVTLAADLTITGSLVQDGGTFAGAARLTIAANADYEWIGGSSNSSGGSGVVLSVCNGASLNIRGSGVHANQFQAISNHGMLNFADAGSVIAADLQNVRIDNETDGVMTMSGTGTVLQGPPSSLMTVWNRGTIYTTSEGNIVWDRIELHNQGTLNIHAGNLVLGRAWATVALSQITTAEGSALVASGGTWSIGALTTFSGDGRLVIQDNAQVTVDGNLSMPNLSLLSGSIIGTADLSGNANLTIAKSMYWSGGSMTGEGATTLAAGGILHIAGDLSLGRVFNIYGMIDWSPVLTQPGVGGPPPGGGTAPPPAVAVVDGSFHNLVTGEVGTALRRPQTDYQRYVDLNFYGYERDLEAALNLFKTAEAQADAAYSQQETGLSSNYPLIKRTRRDFGEERS
jgi:hypothetical protein